MPGRTVNRSYAPGACGQCRRSFERGTIATGVAYIALPQWRVPAVTAVVTPGRINALWSSAERPMPGKGGAKVMCLGGRWLFKSQVGGTEVANPVMGGQRCGAGYCVSLVACRAVAGSRPGRAERGSRERVESDFCRRASRCAGAVGADGGVCALSSNDRGRWI